MADKYSNFQRLKHILEDTDVSRFLNQRTSRFFRRCGRRPRILLIKSGPKTALSIDKLMPSAFSHWGFDVDIHSAGLAERTATENNIHAVIYPFGAQGNETGITEVMPAMAALSGRNLLRVAWQVASNGHAASGDFDEWLRIGPELPSDISRLLDRIEKTDPSPPSVEQCFDGVVAGDRTVIAKALTLVESQRHEDQQMADQLIGRLLPLTGQAIRIGISGIPGAGKSTFIENFGMMLTERGHRVAVLAVDPSSQVTGGSILGDKTRMKRLSGHPNAFIRPTASGGSLGGVAGWADDEGVGGSEGSEQGTVL